MRRPLGVALATGIVLSLVAGCTTGSPPPDSPSASPAASTPAAQPASPPASTPSMNASVNTPVVTTPVDPALFGMHVSELASGDQPLPELAGSIRLWDSGVAWRQLEPTRGQIDWAPLDRAVELAESTGARQIVWVHGSTPQWAARRPHTTGLYGPGTSSPPKAEPYLKVLRKVAKRYRGRITAYQVWNEANLPIFYDGSASYLAELTARAREVLDEVDPDAELVGASTTVREYGPVKSWYGRYADALADLGWPVDAMTVHLYPRAAQGPNARADYIRSMRTWLDDRGWTGPLWDTEVNYGDRRDFAAKIVEVPQRVATRWVARTYIDSLALGVQRVFWYRWNKSILGIDLTDPDNGRVLPAGQAYLTVQDWLDGATWAGCTGELIESTGEPGALTTCDLTDSDGNPAQILFTIEGHTTLAAPTNARQLCRLDDTCSQTGTRIDVGPEPLLLRLDH